MVPREHLVCPDCRATLDDRQGSLSCSRCNEEFGEVEGVLLLLRGVKDPSAHKLGQVEFFDNEADPEFEIARPHGTPRLYEWLIEEKFRRSVASLRSLLPGATVLAVCGGSGMDAELLARAGATVVCSDLSLGAALRARERGRRYRVRIESVVADVEALPFADQSFDLVYVHDGLHHLEDPFVGLDEVARVARHAVSVNEPARAAATELAIRFGAAGRVEDAGNVIARIDPRGVAMRLESAGFRILRVERYGMYYKHKPGRVMELLSAPIALQITTAGIRSFNALFGRLGNKSTVQAVRA